MNKSKPTLTYADITWLKSEFLPDLALAVQKGLEKKLNAIDTKLDTFVGEIKAKREEQTLHQGKHEEIEQRVSTIEKHINLPVTP